MQCQLLILMSSSTLLKIEESISNLNDFLILELNYNLQVETYWEK